MLEALQIVATLTAALFAGAAIYINVAEHPARMVIDMRSAALQWAPSYKRATWMQAPLAIVSFLTGVGAWLFGRRQRAMAHCWPPHRRRSADHLYPYHADES
jgi:hypothetical protein